MGSRKKLNVSILSVRDFEGGVAGTLGERQTLTRDDGTPCLGNFGQVLETFELVSKTGEVQKYWMDGGLRGAFSMAKLKPGMNVEIVHTGEKKLETGFVQTYDIFEIT